MILNSKYRIIGLVLMVLSGLILFNSRLDVSTSHLIILFILLAVISYSDFTCYIIPDYLLMLLVVSWAVNAFAYRLDVIFVLSRMAACALVFILMLVIIVLLERALGSLLMGGGDIKLIAVCTIYIGVNGMLYMMLLMSVMMLIYMLFFKRRKYYPFGPFISIATLVIFMANIYI